MDQQSLVTALYTKLMTSGSTHPAALVSSRIAEGEGPFDEDFPRLLFHVVTDPPDSTFERRNVNADVQIDVFGKKSLGSAAVRAVTDAVKTLLDGSSITVTGCTGGNIVVMDRGKRTTEGDVLRVTQMYRVRATEA